MIGRERDKWGAQAQPQTSGQAQRQSPAGYSGYRPQRCPWFESSELCTQVPGMVRRSSCSGSGEMKYQSWEVGRNGGSEGGEEWEGEGRREEERQ